MEREGRASHKAPLLEHNSERGIVTHPFPMNYILKPWELGRWFYQLVKIGIVQYVCLLSLTERLTFAAFYSFFFKFFFLSLFNSGGLYVCLADDNKVSHCSFGCRS